MKALISAMVAGAAWLVCVATTAPGLAQESRQAASAAQEQGAPPAGHGGMMTGMGGSQAPAGETIAGTVLESVNAAGYTYLRLKTAAGEAWAAVSGEQVAVGSAVTVAVSMRADNFHSKSLDRTFERLYMGALVPTAGAAVPAPPAGPGTLLSSHRPAGPAAAPGAMPPGHPALGADRSLAGPEQPLPRAEGERGRTVAEVWKQRAELKDAQVAVRGRVVKFTPAVMGKNWVHLRDGSGSAATGDDDLTVTTDATVAVGDVVVATGTIRVDRDFGSGYRYPVLVEDAIVAK